MTTAMACAWFFTSSRLSGYPAHTASVWKNGSGQTAVHPSSSTTGSTGLASRPKRYSRLFFSSSRPASRCASRMYEAISSVSSPRGFLPFTRPDQGLHRLAFFCFCSLFLLYDTCPAVARSAGVYLSRAMPEFLFDITGCTAIRLPP